MQLHKGNWPRTQAEFFMTDQILSSLVLTRLIQLFWCFFFNLDLLPSKPKFTFRHLKKGIQEFHRRFFLAPQIRLLTMLWSFEKGTILTP